MTPRRLIEPARHAGTALLRTQSDDRLVDLVRAGNDSAFEAIVHRYRRALLRYCGRILTPARAEDAVQLAFVNAVAALRANDAEIRLRPWLYRIAHNAALNVLRQAGADHEQVSEQIDGVETPPQAVERGERLRAVVAAVQHLPERQRNAIVLQALEGRSYEEIAAELGVTDGAVRQLLNRARTTLRDAATAVTPPALLVRMGGVVEAPVAERVAQAVAGAGGGAALAKVAAVVVAGAAAVGGSVEGLLPGEERRSPGQAAAAAPERDRPDRREAAPTPRRAAIAAVGERAERLAPGADAPRAAARGEGPQRSATVVVRDERDERRREGDSHDDEDGDDREHEDGFEDDHDDSSGPGPGEADDDELDSVVVEEPDNSGPGSYSSGSDDELSDDESDDSEDRSGSDSGSG